MPKYFADKGTTLSFDFGEQRIGMAQGDAEVGTAHPIATITGKNKEQKFASIGKLIQEWQAKQLVVGLPTHADGTEHELSKMARKFGESLHRRFALPVYWVDERFSSIYAETLLSEAQVFGRKRKEVLDQIAAQAILYRFFEEGAEECLK